MKEYTITMHFMIESKDADYDVINEFAEQLSENIMNDDKLIYGNDIEIVGVAVNDVEIDNFDDIEFIDDEE